jgi:hypothetical protein
MVATPLCHGKRIDRVPNGGLAIEVVEIEFHKAFAMIATGQIVDAKKR